jgi:hypothetical protein
MNARTAGGMCTAAIICSPINPRASPLFFICPLPATHVHVFHVPACRPHAACLPRAGFIAFPDKYDSYAAPSSTRPDLCLADLYTTCLNDLTCTGFDTLRNLYTAQLAPIEGFNGMCTYTRILTPGVAPP